MSLVPKVGWKQWVVHRDQGVRDRAELARLDHRTAALVAARIDVAALIEEADGADPATPVEELIGGRRPAQVARLEAVGILTGADVFTLSRETARYSGFGLTSLHEQIDLARAVLGSEPVYRRREVSEIEVPRGDVEVDLDLENIEDGVYMWGALVTDRAGLGVEAGYRAFTDWDPMQEEVELGIFETMWEWLQALRVRVASEGLELRVYCYSASAEGGHLRRLAEIAGRVSEVEEFLQSEQWVDMHPVVKSQLITGGRMGLKDVAPLAGYEWAVDDPGGADSMIRYDEAVSAEDASEREKAREWLLTYNSGDVEATLALREWMERDAATIPSIRETDERFSEGEI